MSTTNNGIFNTNIRIVKGKPLDDLIVWPKNVEIAICRVPIRKRDGYSAAMMAKLATKLKNSMVTNGIVFLICYAPTECKFRPFEVGKSMVDAGFTHIDNIAIVKSWHHGKRSEVNLVNSHEFVLHFCNGNVWNLDRQPIKDYLKVHEDISCPGNSWTIEVGSLDESYPVDLARLCIRMTDALPGSVVFDPYLGGKASLVAAVEAGHSFVGFEDNERKLNQYKKIIDEIDKK